jgi:hypothetical protein
MSRRLGLWILALALPLAALGLLTAFDPNVGGPGVAASDIAVVAAWGVASLLVAMRTSRWTPQGD